MHKLTKLIKILIKLFLKIPLLSIILAPIFLIISLVAHFKKREIIGLGPEPLINNVHHKKALINAGYKSETFVNQVYYITSDFDLIMTGAFSAYRLFMHVLLNYKILYIYFNGGPLAWSKLRLLEPIFYRIAGIKTVLMPYGGDVQDFSRYNDVVYRAACSLDYPDYVRKYNRKVGRNLKFWSRWADWIISGCDWVRYMPYWDTLMLAHFSVDTNLWFPAYINNEKYSKRRPLNILHAPNHKAIKGTVFIEKVINKLTEEGYCINLNVVQKVPNDKFSEILRSHDVVIEQLIIGWYGIAALEAMSSGKPVLTYISDELERLYIMNSLLDPDELPFIKVDHNTLSDELIKIYEGYYDLNLIGTKSRKYVEKHHSLEYVGSIFAEINIKLGLNPSER